jgi:hypothetical protein
VLVEERPFRAAYNVIQGGALAPAVKDLFLPRAGGRAAL